MPEPVDWSWKIREAIERIKTRYRHIGRKTGVPFLAVIYPCDAEGAFLKEWRTQASTLGPEFELYSIDVLEITMSVVSKLGANHIVGAMEDPMPGSNPELDLGHMWITAVARAVCEKGAKPTAKKPVIVLERLAALYPAAGPRAVMQELWGNEHCLLDWPVVFLIPGTLIDRRIYAFVDQREEFMYRGDIL